MYYTAHRTYKMSEFQDHLTEALADPEFALYYLVEVLNDESSMADVLILLGRIKEIHTHE